ncbi:MAG: hypothetical protein ACPLXB_01555 [Minisyncoccia bacterium]
MAIEIQQEKKGNPFIWLIILVILGLIGWFGWQFFEPLKYVKQPEMKELLPFTSQLLIEAKLDTQGVINHPVFQNLNSHIEWPLPSGQLGKTNPFQPY